MRFVLLLLSTILVALATGFGLSYYALNDGRLVGAVQIGAWTSWPDLGAASPNPYSRGHLAREAALQLGRSEGLRFTATTDSAGEPLDLRCTYVLEGHVPVSTFWTLVALDPAGRNLAAPETDLALRSSEIARDNSGAMVVSVGTALRPGNWLELAGRGPFGLALTLYDTTAFSGFGADNDTMPTITRGACA
ncbi:hypothetical protein SAMN05216456_2277 [Devosia crocina]|uniref:DUF1214 domain-containing protein n=1 Tax=Devosia crocina TaxID=429728 RepID=A0A1I7NML3_9HYPH|nr:DUF1214 domain-containing protein [Devosia crocina]SFV35923.1 hypothetical protein SAMN05216456_2277 [Devosia crocina]